MYGVTGSRSVSDLCESTQIFATSSGRRGRLRESRNAHKRASLFARKPKLACDYETRDGIVQYMWTGACVLLLRVGGDSIKYHAPNDVRPQNSSPSSFIVYACCFILQPCVREPTNRLYAATPECAAIAYSTTVCASSIEGAL